MEKGAGQGQDRLHRGVITTGSGGELRWKRREIFSNGMPRAGCIMLYFYHWITAVRYARGLMSAAH